MSGPSTGALAALFAVVCALLVVKAQVLAAATAAARGTAGKFVNPEDAAWLGGEHVAADDGRVRRLFRAHRNDLESLLPFFVGGTLYLNAGAAPAVGAAYFCAFLLARYVHTYAYLAQRPRLRRNAFTAGWLVAIVMSIHAAWGALTPVLS